MEEYFLVHVIKFIRENTNITKYLNYTYIFIHFYYCIFFYLWYNINIRLCGDILWNLKIQGQWQ